MASQSTQSSSTNSTVKKLTINDLPLLCNTLNPVASKCFDLGLQLGIKEARIRTIMVNYRSDCEAQLREIISERLKQTSPLTWHDVVTALRSPSVNHPDIVRHIYKSPSSVLQQHPSSDPQHYPASDPQQHLSLGGEHPYPMLIMGQRISSREDSNMGTTSVPTSSMCGVCFKTIIKPVFSCLLCRREAPHGENSHSSPQMIGQTSVRGPLHEENYQPFAQMKGLADIRPPERDALRSSYTHHMTYERADPDLLSTTQHSPTNHTQRSSASAYHRSPMDTFVHYVKSTYKQCKIERNLNVLKWPPTPSKIFINLACINWESVMRKEETDEYTRTMLEDGNVDVILKKKRKIDFIDILPPVTASEKVILVEGAAGVGKSTFAWEFCRRWEKGEIAQQYQLVLLLRLRDEGISRAKSLTDLICHSAGSVCHAIVDELESTFGVNTLIILEGFDQLPEFQQKKSSIFLQLILGRLLLHATIMITSRPLAIKTGNLLAQIKHRIFQHVEILGFTEEDITKYVTSVFTGEGKKTASTIEQSVRNKEEIKKNINDMMVYIEKYPQIKACMYIPLNAAIVVSIYRESMKSKWVLPKTLTELYQALARILLLRYLRAHAKYHKCRIGSFEDLPREVYTQLLIISKIAYDGVCRESGKSIQLIFSDIPDDFETLGLMQNASGVHKYTTL